MANDIQRIRSQVWRDEYHTMQFVDLIFYLTRLRFFQNTFLIISYVLLPLAGVVALVNYFTEQRLSIYVAAAVISVVFLLFMIANLVLFAKGYKILKYLAKNDENFIKLKYSYGWNSIAAFASEKDLKRANEIVLSITGETE
ncbi:hypothetical protein ACA758_04010 [Mycoplasmopsis agassizii]|uniref:hypothetical protein n=1 Tax=Mycoplasmopsis agassizii TaxID=33922 RepID=UPI0035282573